MVLTSTMEPIKYAFQILILSKGATRSKIRTINVE